MTVENNRDLDLRFMNSALNHLEGAKADLHVLLDEPSELTAPELEACQRALGKVLPAIGILKRGIDHEITG